MSRRAFHVVDEFEGALAEYTGAPHAVCVDSCSNALMLALAWWRLQHEPATILIPTDTYVGVPVACWNAGHDVQFEETLGWQDGGFWSLIPTDVIDSARYLSRGMYIDFDGTTMCLSFSMEKHLPVGRGGAILTDNHQAAEWFTKARHDGRTPGDPQARIVWPSWHVNMAPDVAARGLWLLDHLPDQPPPLEPTDYPDLRELCRNITDQPF